MSFNGGPLNSNSCLHRATPAIEYKIPRMCRVFIIVDDDDDDDDEETHGLQMRNTERCSPGVKRISMGRIETPKVPSELA